MKMNNLEQAAANYAAQDRETRSEHAAFVAGAMWNDMNWKLKTMWRNAIGDPPPEGMIVLCECVDGHFVGYRDGNAFRMEGRIDRGLVYPEFWRTINF